MADNINLPNLVSHLAVNLDGLNGTIADAQRQGSSVGAALGGGIQRELRDLVAHLPDVQIDGNSTDLDRDLARVRREMDELSNQRIGVDISIEEALRRINELQPHINRIGDQHPDINVRASTRAAARQLDELLAAARRVDDTDVDIDVDVDVDRPQRLTGILGRLTGGARGAAGALAGVGKAAAGIGAAVPLVAGVATTLANILPAAGVAVTGMAAVQLASGTVKLAAIGMKDALTAALDPSDPEAYADSLKKLAPEARKFAEAVHDAAPALHDLQQDVQNEVFRGLAENLERTATSVLPVLRRNLLTSATAMGDMAAGALGAGKELADSGTLGRALGSASKGLRNLSGIPGIVVTALGQIGAAAGPSFESLTDGASHAAAAIGERLGRAFESGAMQDAIEHAMDLLGQLLTVGSNVGKIIGGIFNAVPSGGGGLIAVLEDVTAAIAEVVNTAEVQDALRALFETMGTIGQTVAPLLAQALQAMAPVIAALGPPIQTLVTSLGNGLSPIIDALGPVLEAAAVAIGALIEAIAPLLPIVGDLIAALLPALTPLLTALAQVFEEAAPVVLLLAQALADALAPILAELPGFVQPFADILVQLAETVFPVLAELIVALAPSLITLGESFAELMVATAPLIEVVGQLVIALLEALMPIIEPLIGLIADLASMFSSGLAAVITGVVVPALQIVVALLTGDFAGAWQIAKNAVGGAVDYCREQAIQLGVVTVQGVSTAVDALKGMPGQAQSALSALSPTLGAAAGSAGRALVAAVRERTAEAIIFIRTIPGRAVAALGGLTNVLTNAGRGLIAGFIAGIRSMIPSVQGVLSGLTSQLPFWKGPASLDAKILTPAGQLLIQGFIRGITSTTPKLKAALAKITAALPKNVTTGVGRSLSRGTAELRAQVAARESVLKRLASAQKALATLVKKGATARTDVTEGILTAADITSGRGDVNSVSAITIGLQQALAKAKEFQANIARLRTSGLRADLLEQIADAGVDGGAATAAALARATPAELKKINDLQGQLATAATATGVTVGDALYTAGVRAATGLVAGLKSQEKAIEAQMKEIATLMLATVRSVHKTHSPSVAFRDIGVMDMEGWRGGIKASAARVIAATRSVAAGVLDVSSGISGALVSTPSAAQLVGAYAGGGGDTHNVFNLYGTETSPDGILRALSWRGLVGRR